MQNILIAKLITIGLVFLITIIAGWYPFRKRIQSPEGYDFPIGEALACGVFLGVGLIHLLSTASNDFLKLNIHYPLAFVIAGLTFLGLLWLEHVASELQHHGSKENATLVILAVVMLSVHSLLAGAALGLTRHFSVFIMLLIAILAHKWAAGFSLAVEINKSKLSIKVGILLFFIFALMVPLGIVFGTALRHVFASTQELTAIVMALAAGTFLYLGTLHGLWRATMLKHCCNLRHYSFVVLGFLLMALVAIWL